MRTCIKKILIGILIISVLIIIGFVIYKLYDAAIVNAIERIKEGVRKGTRSMMNPFRMIGIGK